MMRSLRWIGFGLALIAFGCKVTPDYERPELDLPDSWIHTTDSRESIANLDWWNLYEDPDLIDLIELALDENRDLAIALARMQEAEYLVTFTRAEQFPFLDIFGSAGRGRQSREIIPGADTDNNFAIGANLSFEVDLWRKYARGTEAARAELLSTEAAYRSVTTSLVADVASTYFLLQDTDMRLDISIRTAAGRADRVRIVQARFDQGIVPEIDLNQAQVQLAIAEASIARFERLTAQTEHALRVLIGGYPGPIPRGKPIGLGDVPVEVPAGLPSDLLERRPDIVDSEQRLIAETAKIGVSQAMRFPALSLTASVSAVATDLTDLNSTDAGEWSIMAGIFQPIFNSGRLKAQMKAQTERAEQAMHAYLLTLQNAFREVEDSLVAIETFRDELSARRRQVKAASNALRLSQARYDAGVVDYLEVLDSERTLFNAELQVSIILRSALTSYVELYKALGGGWNELEEEDEGEGEGEGEEGDQEGQGGVSKDADGDAKEGADEAQNMK